MTAPPPPVNPTVTDVFFAVVRLEGKVDVIGASGSGMERQLADHETRLRKLESSRWPVRSITVLMTIAGVLVASAAVIVPVIMTLH